MPDKHLSSGFDADLNLVLSNVFEMGGIVESQVVNAMQALHHFDLDLVGRILVDERRLNAMEAEVDEECINIIARRQPAARDLRLLMSISKTVTNLERAGDEARKVAKRTRRIADDGRARTIDATEITLSGEMAISLLRRALDAFARLDTVAAVQVVRDDETIDEQFRAFVRKLVSCMKKDPRTISIGLHYLCIAKAIERIGDHATNIAELIVYIVKGKDVRHIPREQLERVALSE
ncbi:PhoU-like phosphate uptake regulator [Paraburkholderia sp. BL6669N2]|uniref:phosphate signaling complex protein PhoU n=1 Tax=unclassified Paraburkholderia TaxID=2615204 RepID=UPI000D0720F0|nr:MULTISPECIES: phosphate signaling complex protein PhoU [unclassified Paraburkholderia]PRX33375.1 PhoU-like phosphate uptake regulator [Paraburkholderia sp. BL18I3N2]REG60778.1 PhoU-like phosphate uptake regulator [Paraburkholderia sp. BL6669N2]